MPGPRKLRLADVKIAEEMLIENCAATTGSTLGQTWRRMIHSGLPPMARAASTNKVSRITSAWPRTRSGDWRPHHEAEHQDQVTQISADHHGDDEGKHNAGYAIKRSIDGRQ